MRAPMRALGIRPASLAVHVGGTACPRAARPIGPNTSELWTHSFDYDLFMATKDAGTRTGTAVFLDEGVPAHPDYARRGHRPYSRAERYYPELRRFLDAFERGTGLAVVVAGHPRTDHKELSDDFGKRRTIRGRTAELTRDSDAVITHSSTATAFAVLFGKPVVLATSADLRASPQAPLIEAMARSLNKRPLDLAQPELADWKAELVVDEKAYADYRSRYVKKDGTPEKPLWDIVADSLGLPEASS